jgi:hypothetical protein
MNFRAQTPLEHVRPMDAQEWRELVERQARRLERKARAEAGKRRRQSPTKAWMPVERATHRTIAAALP